MKSKSDHYDRESQALLARLVTSSKALKNVPKIALEAVLGIGLFTAQIEDETAPLIDERQAIASWCAIYDVRHHAWMDLVIEADRREAEHAFQVLTGETAVSLSDCYDVFGEIGNYVRGALKRGILSEYSGCFTPGTPKYVPGGNLHSILNYPCARIRTQMRADGVRIAVTLLIHEQRPVAKTMAKLRELDVTMEPIVINPSSKLEIVAKGVVLSRLWIEKLRNRFMHEEKERHVAVISPPPVTSLFHPGFAQTSVD